MHYCANNSRGFDCMCVVSICLWLAYSLCNFKAIRNAYKSEHAAFVDYF